MNLGPECLKCGLAQDWDHGRHGCERPVLRHMALCDWCHKREYVTDGAAADVWLRTHDCPEAVKS